MIRLLVTPDVKVCIRPETVDITPLLLFVEDGLSMTLAKIMINGQSYELKYNEELTLEKDNALQGKET